MRHHAAPRRDREQARKVIGRQRGAIGNGLDAQGIVEVLLDPGENGDDIRRVVRHELVHAAGIAWTNGDALIGTAVRCFSLASR